MTPAPTASRHRLVLPLVLGAVLILSGCAMLTQNPGGRISPVNAVKTDNAERLMLKGADVVAYFTQGRYVPGQARFSSTFEDVQFHFASAEHKALFDKEPRRYLPEFGGYCANGLVYGIPWGGDADTWKMIDGKLYIFGGASSKAAWELDEKANLALAQRYWTDEVRGTNSFVQRAKRMVFRVPHYKNGEQLAKEVAAKGKS